MFGMIKAGWRVRRNLRIHQQWVEYFDNCPVPPGVSCAECETEAKKSGDVESHRRAVEWYRGVMA